MSVIRITNIFLGITDATNCRVGPNSVARCTVDPGSDGVHHVSYVPMEVGDYNVMVRWNGRDVQGRLRALCSR